MPIYNEASCGGIRSFLEAVVGDDEWLEEASHSSYQHGVGFTKIMLAGGPKPHAELRLHLWEGVSPEQENEARMHSHAWHFASCLLRGDLRTRIWAVDRQGGDYHAYTARAPIDGSDASGFMYDGKASLTSMFSVQHAEGHTYGMNCEAIHSAYAVGAEPSATLLLQGVFRRETISIFSPVAFQSAGSGQKKERRLSANEIRQSIRSFIDRSYVHHP